MIDSLPLLQPNPDRRARTMARCHERLALRQRKLASLEKANARALRFEPIVVAGMCVLYLVDAAGQIIRLRGIS